MNTKYPHRSITLIASLSALIGVIAWCMLLTTAHAQTRPGMPAGGKAFGNPFANPSGDDSDPFFEDDEADPFAEDGKFFPQQNAGNIAQANGAASTLSPAKGGGVSMGGGTPGGVISSGNVPTVSIDSETGGGSNEVVTEFNFPDADIMDIAKALGKLTGKNFILDKDVKGRITIISNSPITVGDAWKAFLTALDINGFAIIPSGKYIRIARQRDARDKQLKTYTGEYSPDTDALITRVFPLKYINAEEVARTFRSFMPANSRIIPYEQTNTVIVTDTGSNISKLSKMLEILDVEGYDAGIEVIQVKYASAVELSKLIDTLIPGTGTAPGAPGGAPRFGGGSRFNARRTKEGGIINTIISDERTNNLIVHANTRGADQVRELVSKLDQKIPSQAGGGKVHVIYLQFADAEALSSTLNNLSSSTKTAAPSAGAGGTGVNPVQQNLFEGNIKVAPDKSTNSLVVTASAADFLTVQRVVNRLDIARDEVFVESVIMEVQVDKQFDYSANVANPTNGVFLNPNTDLIGLVTSGGVPTTAGALFTFKSGSEQSFTVGGQTLKINSLQGLLKMIQSNTNSNVLATPQIIALDNTEATFEANENIPVPQQNFTQSGAATGLASVTFSKEKVALSLKIKPQINKLSNFVKLEVETKIGDISNRGVPAAYKDNTFSTVERAAKTQVVVGDGDTIALGGLMRNKESETSSKVPLLGDIPLLGWLFRAKSISASKTNLLVFITPRIIRQYEKVRAVLDKKLKERDDFIERNAGGTDPLRKERDDIIRGLPDIKALEAEKIEPRVPSEEDHLAPAATVVTPSTSSAPAPAVPLANGASNAAPLQNLGTFQGNTGAPIPPPVPLDAQIAPPPAANPAGGQDYFSTDVTQVQPVPLSTGP